MTTVTCEMLTWHPAPPAFSPTKCSISGCNMHMHACWQSQRYSSIGILSIYFLLSAIFQNTHWNCGFTVGNGSTISVWCVTPHLCITLKIQTTQSKKAALATELFCFQLVDDIAKQMSRYLLFLSLLSHKNWLSRHQNISHIRKVSNTWASELVIVNNFLHKCVGISTASFLLHCRWKYYYFSKGNQAALELVQNFAFSSSAT